MDEESLRFWAIPIVCLVSIMFVFAFAVDYKVNTIFPNAELEIQEIKKMSCPEFLLKDSSNRYWTSENAKIGKAKAVSCIVPQESLSPYVEFCDTTPLDPPFVPDKLIQNATHNFNHHTCVWDVR